MRNVQGAVWGKPVRHSASPLLYSAACEAHGWTCNYMRTEVDQGSFAQALKSLHDYDWVNLTSPLKEEIFKHSVSRLSENAEQTRSANLLYVKDGLVHADNTDVSGFDVYFQEMKIKPQSALIFGTGGAARSCALAFERRGVPVVFASRKASSEAIVQVGSPEYFEAFKRSDCIVQATSIALSLPEEEKSFFYSLFPEVSTFKVAIELNYKRDTVFLRLSRLLQFQTFDGAEMLCEQAAVCFERMTQQKAPREKMREALHNQR